ncbi:homoserine dehydrogenase [Alkalibacillus aidingensis]|uniref:homoserine dehydrogenase n=1 Tax=Alkalibacillus aidingensis TaxID=2747607 RepID=UPI001660C09C|nr:homoserine dehydrogenase [Alkalibacillus aidingensis]
MSSIKVALLGFGTVGSGVYELINHEQKRLRELIGRPVQIVAVLINDERKQRDIDQDILVTSNIDDVLAQEVDVVVEAIVGVEPAYTYLTKAIHQGCHVVTANKEMFAYKGFELRKQANEQRVEVYYEAAVAGAIPIISTLRDVFKVNRVARLEAILNGTTNYILTEMRENGTSLEAALKTAQAQGYAESDPTNDVEGYDALYKLVILSELLLGKQVNCTTVEREGIKEVNLESIKRASKRNHRIKHVAKLAFEGDKLQLYIRPLEVDEDHPLFAVEGVDNAVVVTGNYVGQLKFEGPGAGKFPTASVMVDDLVDIMQQDQRAVSPVVR